MTDLSPVRLTLSEILDDSSLAWGMTTTGSVRNLDPQKSHLPEPTRADIFFHYAGLP
ncbi:MAG: hypothetical protein JWN03_3007 [Nocardia sp.]|nr:hypothetical protein [Nocardia sp.]